MFKIAHRKALKPTVISIDVEAPLVAKKAKPGQFIILRVDDEGERIPLTVAGCNKEEGTVRVIFHVAGATTKKLKYVPEGGYIADFVGPLGNPTEMEGMKRVCVVGGGIGCAIAMPIATAFHEAGCEVTTIIGFRNKDLVILEDEFRAASDNLIIMSDDGSYGREGNVTVPLKEMLAAGERFDTVIVFGPLIMMKFTTLTCKEFGQPCTVSMCPIMIDGTGMCGGCRLTLHKDGKDVTAFACVDGPDFDGYEVDFDAAILRSQTYAPFERHAYEEACNLFKAADEAEAAALAAAKA
jgi:ferredoxin--NADP+ reductase